MKTTYLFIAQKPDSTDYCRGCRMASYSSDFFIENMLNREQLVKRWAEYIQKNMNLDCNETGYDFYVFKNGVKLFEEQYTRWDGAERYEDQWCDEAELEEKDDMAEISEIFSEATALANKLQGDKITKQEKEKAEEIKKEAEKAKQERQALYEKLKKEFDKL